jgi:hypothetical protein
MDVRQVIDERGKIAIYKKGEQNTLTVRVQCSGKGEAEALVAAAGSGRLVRNVWKDKEVWWVRWTGRIAAKLLNGMALTGDQEKRAQIGVSYTVLVYRQWLGHGVGQKITQEQWALRQRLLDQMEELG